MSFEPDEYCEVFEVSHRKARKHHKCSACDGPIRPGDRYVNVFTVFQGDAETIKRCLRCDAIFCAIEQRLGSKGEMYQQPMQNLDCGHTWQENFGEEPPETIAALAFMTPDEAQAKLITLGK